MTSEELYKLSEKYQKKADAAGLNYQETGISRYNREREKNEDLADAIRIAAGANDDYARKIALTAEIAVLATKAQRALDHPDTQQEELTALAEEIIAYARMMGICG